MKCQTCDYAGGMFTEYGFINQRGIAYCHYCWKGLSEFQRYMIARIYGKYGIIKMTYWEETKCQTTKNSLSETKI